MPIVTSRSAHTEVAPGRSGLPNATIQAHTQKHTAHPTPPPTAPAPSTPAIASEGVASASGASSPTQPTQETSASIVGASTAKSGEPSSVPQVSAPSEEPKAATPVTSKPQPPADSARFAALARREKQMRQEKADIDAREKAFQTREQTIREEARAEVIRQLQQDTLGTLQQHGIDYNRLTESLLNPPSPEAKQIAELKSEIAKIQKSQESTQQEWKNSQQTAYENALNQVRNDVKVQVERNNDFATIKAMSAEESVVELIKQTFDSDGVLLTTEDACKEVETYLLDEAIRMASLDKVKSKLAPLAQPDSGNQPVTPQQQPSRTLSHSIAQSSHRPPLTMEERRARAIAAFNGQLKS